MSEQEPGGLTAEQRAEFRAFVRTHHPDRGGDPDTFVAGLARFRELARTAGPSPSTSSTRPTSSTASRPADRYDAPIRIVRDLPFPARVAVAVIRTVRRRRHLRVDRPTPHTPRRTT